VTRGAGQSSLSWSFRRSPVRGAASFAKATPLPSLRWLCPARGGHRHFEGDPEVHPECDAGCWSTAPPLLPKFAPLRAYVRGSAARRALVLAEQRGRGPGHCAAPCALIGALVPPPRFHWMRYLSVLAVHSSRRAEVVPRKPAARPTQLPLFDDADEPTTSAKSATKMTAETSRHSWSWRLQRVFAVDIFQCEKCGGRLQIVEIAKTPDDIARVLDEREYARAPPDPELQAAAHGPLRLVFG
jgi:hypothetical protein